MARYVNVGWIPCRCRAFADVSRQERLLRTSFFSFPGIPLVLLAPGFKSNKVASMQTQLVKATVRFCWVETMTSLLFLVLITTSAVHGVVILFSNRCPARIRPAKEPAVIKPRASRIGATSLSSGSSTCGHISSLCFFGTSWTIKTKDCVLSV